MTCDSIKLFLKNGLIFERKYMYTCIAVCVCMHIYHVHIHIFHYEKSSQYPKACMCSHTKKTLKKIALDVTT